MQCRSLTFAVPDKARDVLGLSLQVLDGRQELEEIRMRVAAQEESGAEQFTKTGAFGSHF